MDDFVFSFQKTFVSLQRQIINNKENSEFPTFHMAYYTSYPVAPIAPYDKMFLCVPTSIKCAPFMLLMAYTQDRPSHFLSYEYMEEIYPLITEVTHENFFRLINQDRFIHIPPYHLLILPDIPHNHIPETADTRTYPYIYLSLAVCYLWS